MQKRSLILFRQVFPKELLVLFHSRKLRYVAPLFVFVALLAVTPARLHAQEPTGGDKPLVDHSLESLMDGRMRPNVAGGYTEAYLPVLFRSSHAANLLQLRNGDILCVWFSGSWEGSSGVGIVVSRLPKGSFVWTPTSLIDSHDGESYQNPVVFEAPDGAVHVFHTTQGAEAGEANAHVLHVISRDHGVTWTKPELLFEKPGSFTRDPLLIRKDGAWLLPLTYVTSFGIGKGAETNYSSVKVSKNGGSTWTECLVPVSGGKVQPSLVAGSHGGFIAFLRDRASNHIYRSTSPDGCQWSEPAATSLPNNNASIQAFRLRSGHVVIAFNNSAADRSGPKAIGGLRKPLTVALSADDGLTWSTARDIETGRPGYGQKERDIKEPGREEYSYPTVMEARDGSIFVAFTFRRQTIKVVRFPESWIQQGHTEGFFRP